MGSAPDLPAAEQRMPSLLRSLLSDHLDPGYAAAAQRRRSGAAVRQADWLWQALGAALIAVVFAAAVAQARTTAPGVSAAQRVLADSVRSVQGRVDHLTSDRATLASEEEQTRRRELVTGATGRSLLAGLDAASLSGAATAVIGPGLTITVVDPGTGRELTDTSAQRVPGTRQVVLDRDLQQVVNSLWAAGAEAISVGGVRIGPDVTIRQAGGAILVDNQPVASPYVVQAVGPPDRMPESFQTSSGLERLRLLEAAYGARVSVSATESLSLPAAAGREVTFAREAQ